MHKHEKLIFKILILKNKTDMLLCDFFFILGQDD